MKKDPLNIRNQIHARDAGNPMIQRKCSSRRAMMISMAKRRRCYWRWGGILKKWKRYLKEWSFISDQQWGIDKIKKNREIDWLLTADLLLLIVSFSVGFCDRVYSLLIYSEVSFTLSPDSFPQSISFNTDLSFIIRHAATSYKGTEWKKGEACWATRSYLQDRVSLTSLLNQKRVKKNLQDQ